MIKHLVYATVKLIEINLINLVALFVIEAKLLLKHISLSLSHF